jgi:hypothetical protein
MKFTYQLIANFLALMFGQFKLSVIPTLADFKDYVVSKAGEPEVFWQPRYDWNLYPQAGINQILFFQQPVGSGVTSAIGAVVGSAKSIADTNMELQGQIPSPQGFQVESIEVLFFPGASAAANTFTPQVPNMFAVAAAASVGAQLADQITVHESGVLTFFILSKTYLTETPLGRLPPKTHFEAHGAIASNSATVGEAAIFNAFSTGQPYFLEVPISLTANGNFNVTVAYPAPVALPSGFNGRLGVYLNGFNFRNAQ